MELLSSINGMSIAMEHGFIPVSDSFYGLSFTYIDIVSYVILIYH